MFDKGVKQLMEAFEISLEEATLLLNYNERDADKAALSYMKERGKKEKETRKEEKEEEKKRKKKKEKDEEEDKLESEKKKKKETDSDSQKSELEGEVEPHEASLGFKYNSEEKKEKEEQDGQKEKEKPKLEKDFVGCRICLKYTSDMEFAMAPCGHFFCLPCLKNWKIRHTKTIPKKLRTGGFPCPYCRTVIPKEWKMEAHRAYP